MQVWSTLGSGSTFALELPLRRTEGSGSIERLPELGADPGSARPPLRARVLLAESSADGRRLIARILRDVGAEVDIAQTGQRAIDSARAALALGEPHDLILLDLEMPDVDGREAARVLRAAGATAPILALTVHSRAEQRERCLAAGCTDLAGKPIDWRSFLDQVTALCAKPGRA
jgi:CheY-like chemotaxis protein